VVAADQRMVIRCYGDDLAGFVHDVSHVPPPSNGDRETQTAIAISATSMMEARLGSSTMRHSWWHGVDLDHPFWHPSTRSIVGEPSVPSAVGMLRRAHSETNRAPWEGSAPSPPGRGLSRAPAHQVSGRASSHCKIAEQGRPAMPAYRQISGSMTGRARPNVRAASRQSPYTLGPGTEAGYCRLRSRCARSRRATAI
jgi:hypothetical protein